MTVYDRESEPRLRRLTDAEVEEAKRVIAAQASTRPAANKAGVIDLSPEGSLRRSEGVCGVDGRRLGVKLGEPLGFPSLNRRRA